MLFKLLLSLSYFPSINSHRSLFSSSLASFWQDGQPLLPPPTPSLVNVQDSLPSTRQSSCHNALNQTWGEAGAERSGHPIPQSTV